jgi:hypothetical protein
MSSVVPNIPDEELDVLLAQAELNVATRARKPRDVARAVQNEFNKLVKARASVGDIPVFQSDKAEVAHRRRLSVHEIGHSLLGAKFGSKIHVVEIDVLGGGVTRLEQPDDPFEELVVSVAGFAAVAVVSGIEPTVEAFRADDVNRFDVEDAEIIVDSEDLGDKPVTRALEVAAEFLRQDSVRAVLEVRARELNKVRRLTGRLFD